MTGPAVTPPPVPVPPPLGSLVADAVTAQRAVRESLARLATAVGDEVADALGLPRETVRAQANSVHGGTVEVVWYTTGTASGTYRDGTSTPWYLDGVGHGATLRELWARRARAAGVEKLTPIRASCVHARAMWRDADRALQTAVHAAVLEVYGSAAVYGVYEDGEVVWWRAPGSEVGGRYHVQSGLWSVAGGGEGPDLGELKVSMESEGPK
jgi:hypothetical protein